MNTEQQIELNSAKQLLDRKGIRNTHQGSHIDAYAPNVSYVNGRVLRLFDVVKVRTYDQARTLVDQMS